VAGPVRTGEAAAAPVPEPSGGNTEPAAAHPPTAAYPPASAPPPELPTETTSFIGREAELDTIEELLRLSRLRDIEALLIVDNCEHVIEAAADTIAALLRSCSRLI
jgi:hypothetical protein